MVYDLIIKSFDLEAISQEIIRYNVINNWYTLIFKDKSQDINLKVHNLSKNFSFADHLVTFV